jgi:hypothetical protein
VAQRERPRLALDGPAHRRHVVGRQHVVVVEIADVAAVERVAHDRLERAAEPAGIDAAVAPRRRVARIEHRDVNVRRALAQQRLDDRALAAPAVDADHQVDAAVEALRIDGANRLGERRAGDRRHRDADVEGCLRVIGHGGWRGLPCSGPCKPAGEVYRRGVK